MNFAILLSYMLTIVLFLGTPGPVTALVIHASGTGGLRKGLLTIAGTNLASLVLIGASFVVLRGFLALNEKLLTVFTLLGALYMLYFATSILRSPPGLATAEPAPSQPGRADRPFLNGLLVGISNPKDIIFFLSFFPTFLAVTPHVLASMAVLLAVWMVMDYTILSAYAFAFAKLVTPKVAAAINKLSALVLLLLALFALYRTVMQLV